MKAALPLAAVLILSGCAQTLAVSQGDFDPDALCDDSHYRQCEGGWVGSDDQIIYNNLPRIRTVQANAHSDSGWNENGWHYYADEI